MEEFNRGIKMEFNQCESRFVTFLIKEKIKLSLIYLQIKSILKLL